MQKRKQCHVDAILELAYRGVVSRWRGAVDVIALLRLQIRAAYEFLDVTIADATTEQLNWLPSGVANPLAAVYAHALVAFDGVLHGMLLRRTPMFESSWEFTTGINEPQWALEPAWAKRVRVDLPIAREYGKAILAAADDYLAHLDPNLIDQTRDLSAQGLGTQTLGWIISRLIVGHLDNMTGEVSCLKGLQGAKGYPY